MSYGSNPFPLDKFVVIFKFVNMFFMDNLWEFKECIRGDNVAYETVKSRQSATIDQGKDVNCDQDQKKA